MCIRDSYYATYVESNLIACTQCAAETACPIGQIWQHCSETTDAMCVPCTSLSQQAEYAQNEEYFNGTEAEGGTCATRCKSGFYRDQLDRYCKRCWTGEELIRAAGPGFFSVAPCTDTHNTQLNLCVDKPGSTITAHDLEMHGDCPRSVSYTHLTLPTILRV